MDLGCIDTVRKDQGRVITKISASVDRRAAQKGQKAVEILAFLRSEPIKNRLIKAAQDGIPPAGAVSEALIERFGLEIFESNCASSICRLGNPERDGRQQFPSPIGRHQHTQ